jgi:hypothetical protein
VGEGQSAVVFKKWRSVVLLCSAIAECSHFIEIGLKFSQKMLFSADVENC